MGTARFCCFMACNNAMPSRCGRSSDRAALPLRSLDRSSFFLTTQSLSTAHPFLIASVHPFYRLLIAAVYKFVPETAVFAPLLWWSASRLTIPRLQTAKTLPLTPKYLQHSRIHYPLPFFIRFLLKSVVATSPIQTWVSIGICDMVYHH